MTEQELANMAVDLDAVDKEILRLKYTNRNMSLTQIGKLLDVPISRQSVHNRLVKKKMQDAMEFLEKDVLHHLRLLQFKAVKVLKDTLDCSDKKLAYNAARDLLQGALASSNLIPKEVHDETLRFIETENANTQE